MADGDGKRPRKSVSRPDILVGAEYHNAIQGGVRPASEKYSFYCFQNARINGTGQEFGGAMEEWGNYVGE